MWTLPVGRKRLRCQNFVPGKAKVAGAKHVVPFNSSPQCWQWQPSNARKSPVS